LRLSVRWPPLAPFPVPALCSTTKTFRILINDMLEQVRDLQRHAGPWPPEERATAEEALERIMSQVRQEAVRRGAT
jgi:hypothetical protein